MHSQLTVCNTAILTVETVHSSNGDVAQMVERMLSMHEAQPCVSNFAVVGMFQLPLETKITICSSELICAQVDV